MVADDVIGGVFAINGGGLGTDRGNVYYHSPDNLTWEPLERGYSDFLYWCFNAELDDFYSGSRWTGWQTEIADLPGDQSVLIYPPLFTQGPDVAQRHRGRVPAAELYGLLVVDWPEQLGTHAAVPIDGQ